MTKGKGGDTGFPFIYCEGGEEEKNQGDTREVIATIIFGL